MNSNRRQPLLFLFVALLALTLSTRSSAQSVRTGETAYAQIADQADILFFTGAQDAAIGYLYYLYEAIPENQVKTAVMLASRLDLTGRNGDAKELLNDIFRRKAQQALASRELAQHYLTLLYSSAEIEQADSLFALLPAEVSTHPEILLIRLMSLAAQGKHEEVLTQIERLDTTLLTDRKLQEAYNYLIAESASKQGDYQRMLQATERLVELSPSNLAAHQMHLEALNALRRDDQIASSLAEMKQIFSLPDTYIDATQAELISDRKDTQLAADFLYHYLQRQDSISSFSARILSTLLPDFSDIRQIPEEYIPALIRLAELEPSDPSLFADVYKIVSEHQGEERGKDLLQQFYDNPQTAYSAVLVSASQLNDYERLNYLASAKKRCPANLEITALYAGELIARDRFEEALQTISSQLDLSNHAAIKAQKPSEGLRLLLLYSTLIYQHQEDEKLTLQTFELAKELFPRDAILLNNYAYYLYTLAPQDSTRLAEAERLASTAYSLAPEEANVLDTYGTILLAEGNTTMAQLMLSQAVERSDELGTPNAGYIERLGDAYLLSGDTASALKQWQRAYELRPSESLRQKIQQHTP